MAETEIVKYPCPKCGTYYEPVKHIGQYAYMDCKEHGLFKTSKKVSLHFREFCSKIARQPNRNPNHYTSDELKVKQILDEFNLIENLDYFHNPRVRLNKRYYWLDFVLPKVNWIIEVSPRIWHRMWNREEGDKRKYKGLSKLGYNIAILTDTNRKLWKDIIKTIIEGTKKSILELRLKLKLEKEKWWY